MLRERIVLEHGPADGYTHSTRPTAAMVVVPVGPMGTFGSAIRFEHHCYHRTLRNSGKPEFRRIYTWIE